MGRGFVRGNKTYTLGATVENKQAPTLPPGLEVCGLLRDQTGSARKNCRNSVLRTSQALTRARRGREGRYRLRSGGWGAGLSKRHNGNVWEEMERKGGKLGQIR